MPDWPRPPGYAHGVLAGRMLFVSGAIGWDQNGQFAGPDLVAQVRQALQNIVVVLQQGGAQASHVARMTWYVVDKREYLAASTELGQVYRAVMGPHYPAMSVLEVSSLLEDAARVEIEATAVLPE